MTQEQKENVNYLVKMVGQGDDVALSNLYFLMREPVFKFLNNRCRDKQLIEDVVQDTFLCIVTKSKNKMFYKNCYSWIFTIARYTLQNKNKKVKREMPIEDFYCETLSNGEDLYEKTNLDVMIEKLPNRSQQILFLKYSLDMTIEEVGKVMKISRATVKRDLKESLDTLKELDK